MPYSTNLRKIRMSRQDACKASSRRFISREQLSTDKEFIEIDNVSYTIASRLIFNISLEVFNQVWMRINAMDYDALVTAYTDDVIIKYDDEPEAEETAFGASRAELPERKSTSLICSTQLPGELHAHGCTAQCCQSSCERYQPQNPKSQKHPNTLRRPSTLRQ